MFTVKAKQTKKGIKLRIKCSKCSGDVKMVTLTCASSECNVAAPIAEREKALYAQLQAELARIGI